MNLAIPSTDTNRRMPFYLTPSNENGASSYENGKQMELPDSESVIPRDSKEQEANVNLFETDDGENLVVTYMKG